MVVRKNVYYLNRSGWETLVQKSGLDNLGMEEEFSVKYKCPLFLKFLSHRLSVFLIGYASIVLIAYLGDWQEVTYETGHDYQFNPLPSVQNYDPYNRVYDLSRPLKY